MNNINLLYVFLDATAVTLLATLAIQLIRVAPDRTVAWLLGIIYLGIISYVISSRHDYGVLVAEPFRLDLGPLHPLLNISRNATIGAFMLLSHAIFRDGQPLPRVLIALWALQIFVEEPLHWILGPEIGSGPIQTTLFEAVPAALQLTFLCFSLYWMVSNREADLVASRRRARVLIIIVYALQVTLSLVVERVAFGFGWVPYELQYPIHMLLICAIIPTAIIALFAGAAPAAAIVLGAPASPPPATAPVPKHSEVDKDLTRIQQAFNVEHIYRQPGLAVRDLAQHLVIPEYRLRSLIHENLGYRNFNALLHDYRIAEVCAALEDPERNTVPVLTLALSAGYQSINPFNRAFRQTKGCTPTEYRRRSQNVVDSSKITLDIENAQ